MMEEKKEYEFYFDGNIRRELEKVRERVLTKDLDFVLITDGEEGSGKSVLAMQTAKILDPNFNINQIVFNAQDFISLIRDPNTKKGTCILLDEAFNAANARASLTEVNRAMIALATEMRQRNLFVIFCLPSIFDLDRYFALHRAKGLFHVYLDENGDRRYTCFDKSLIKTLYLNGKKKYSYRFPRAAFPPAKFIKHYVVDEQEYREKKAKAFEQRPKTTMRQKKWFKQRNALIRFLVETYHLTYPDVNKALIRYDAPDLSDEAVKEIANQTFFYAQND